MHLGSYTESVRPISDHLNPTPDSPNLTNLYYGAAESVDFWGSSPGLPFGEHAAQFKTSNSFSQSMTLNFKTDGGGAAGASNLDILNAESYSYGKGTNGRGSKGRGKRGLVAEEEGEAQALPFGVTNNSRDDGSASNPANSNKRRVNGEEHDGKRRKKGKADVPSDEEDGKKRGRPRKETKDETAAERRRTQIRNAQRAYRNRKETTISSLEDEVQELKGTNEEMSNMFINLYEFAVGKGLLTREQEFAKHFTSTAERFLSLAKAPAGDESSKDDETIIDDNGTRRRSEPGNRSSNSVNSQGESALLPNAAPDTVNPYGGYVVSQEVPSPLDVTPSEPPFSDFQTGTELQLVSQDDSSSFQPNLGVQLIAQATPDNASFFDMFQDMRQFHVDIPTMQNYAQYMPEEILPLPKSFSYSEKTFARRLQREACQRGYALITSPNPNPKRFKEVFSFSLRYTTKAELTARLEELVTTTSKDNLNRWEMPFVHLGGAGTHYPAHQSDKSCMPKFQTGLSMGPFGEEVISTRDNLLKDDWKTFVPGFDFEGRFFDPNDVENYLRSRGIDILEDMQYVPVDLEALIPYDFSRTQSVASSTAPTLSPRTPTSQVSLQSPGSSFAAFPDYLDTFNLDEIITPSQGDRQNLPLFTEWDVETYAQKDSFNPTAFNTVSGQVHSISDTQNKYQQKVISVSVNTLLDALAGKVVCLGRAAGIRPGDVEEAIWTAVREVVSV